MHILRKVKNRLNRLRTTKADQKLRESVEKILKTDGPPDTTSAEAAFDRLQSSYPSNRGDLYKYDDFSLFERANKRAIQILKLPGMAEPVKKILDIGAGDGVLGAMLANFGHSVALTDMEDWRSRMAKNVPFQAANISEGLPYGDGSFDCVVSFNSFEHFPEPKKAFSESLRVTKSGGILHFDFGPLYCSPWGLHAYRSLYMPYSQFLFSQGYIDKKLRELGINDLGKKRTELQYMNRWRAYQFQDLWSTEPTKIVSCRWRHDAEHLGLVKEYPEAFSGRGLCFEDLVRSSIAVVILKI